MFAGHLIPTRRKRSDRFFGILFLQKKKRGENALEDQLIIKLTFPCKTRKQLKEKHIVAVTHTDFFPPTEKYTIKKTERRAKRTREKYI